MGSLDHAESAIGGWRAENCGNCWIGYLTASAVIKLGGIGRRIMVDTQSFSGRVAKGCLALLEFRHSAFYITGIPL